MKITSKGQVTIPPAIRRKHGLGPQSHVEVIDQPNGVLIVKAGRNATRGERTLTTMLRGARVKTRTAEWLKLTRG